MYVPFVRILSLFVILLSFNFIRTKIGQIDDYILLNRGIYCLIHSIHRWNRAAVWYETFCREYKYIILISIYPVCSTSFDFVHQ